MHCVGQFNALWTQIQMHTLKYSNRTFTQEALIGLLCITQI